MHDTYTGHSAEASSPLPGGLFPLAWREALFALSLEFVPALCSLPFGSMQKVLKTAIAIFGAFLFGGPSGIQTPDRPDYEPNLKSLKNGGAMRLFILA
ncbi:MULTISPECIES: hypothetical protein [Caproicibacterium]|uniref:Uncharacterized protein n=1 Tax=Caproicibacterium lactatifermentans TaxID=2666138 RepID=A0A859DTL6_9FIRM|nr:hypothetical protein [Caproicibacterium lactatifermentans]QKN24232.1 hypothetical protein GJQ69_06880 [Caproicibacterium lactatifermentans]QKO30696.1 hypothetical protein GKP14_06635 [Caproicibacterium lactatifermentans]